MRDKQSLTTARPPASKASDRPSLFRADGKLRKEIPTFHISLSSTTKPDVSSQPLPAETTLPIHCDHDDTKAHFQLTLHPFPFHLSLPFHPPSKATTPKNGHPQIPPLHHRSNLVRSPFLIPSEKLTTSCTSRPASSSPP